MRCACNKGNRSEWDFKCGNCRTKKDWADHAMMLANAAVAPGKVTVVNKHTHTPTADDHYIGRGSPLGNPNAITATVTRSTVCTMYVGHITRALSLGDKRVIRALDDIANASLDGKPVNLVCFCAPQQCHGDYVKKLVDQAVREELRLNLQSK